MKTGQTEKIVKCRADKRREMTMSKQLELIDLYIAAFLMLHGVPPRLILKNGKVIFVFDAIDKVYQLMTMFNSNQDVPCLDMITAIKTLRGQMLTLKERENGYENGGRYGYSKY
jgi:hypothetical protein